MPSEDQFLGALFRRLGPFPPEVAVPPGDDCAALRLGSGSLLLVAVDQVVGDRHYCLDGPAAATPEEVGHKLLARNLSDIAAMGGIPCYCLVALGMSPRHDAVWTRRFLDSIADAARRFGVSMIGGDLAATPADAVAALTILGRVGAETVCRRAGAQPGDLLFATGAFGASLPTGHHLRFTPRCAEGRWLAENRYARAMIDVSDGLLLDLERLCRASDVSVRLDPDSIPRRVPGIPLAEVLTDGEDYELLFAVRPERADELIAAWPFDAVPLARIGVFRPRTGDLVQDMNGRMFGAVDAAGAGYDHFRQTPA
ncbi:MAG: thiamine-phosphate kinase [Kiritimatiellaeota bacterium]|nr:thiamine-phosphate kinase [Kiritimatiellota bacterium]